MPHCTGSALRAGVLYGGPPTASVADLCPADLASPCSDAAAKANDGTMLRLRVHRDDLDTAQVSWHGFDDDVPGVAVASFTVSLGSSPRGAQLIAPLQLPPSTSTVTLGQLASASSDTQQGSLANATLHTAAKRLSDGEVLWLTLTAVNTLGLSTTVTRPVGAVDTAAPAPGAVAAVTIGVQAPITSVADHVKGFDTLDLALADDGTVQEVISIPVFSFATAPEPLAGPSAPLVQRNQDVRVTWHTFEDFAAADTADATGDASSGLMAYTIRLVAVDSTTLLPDHDTVYASHTVPASAKRIHTFSAGAAPAGVPMAATVTGVDVAGNALTVASQDVLIVDTTAPVPPDVTRDGLIDRDVDCMPDTGITSEIDDSVPLVVHPQVLVALGLSKSSQVSSATDVSAFTLLSAAWDAFVDPESGVVAIEVAAGNATGAKDSLMGWRDVPLPRSALGHEAATGIHTVPRSVQLLVPRAAVGSRAFVALRARNAVGAVSTPIVTDGAAVLCSPGDEGCDFDGFFVCL